MEENKKKSILIIDDMSQSLRSLKAILDSDYTVRLAKSGELAKSILDSTTVDLILLDIEMPEVTGFEYLNWLKQNPITRSIPVIFVSSHSEAEIVQYAAQQDIKGFIKKPVDPNLLKKRVHEVLEK